MKRILFALALLLAAPAVADVTATSSPTVARGLTCSASAQALPAGNFTNGYIIVAATTNVSTVFIGGSDVNTTLGTGGKGVPLIAGQAASVGSTNSALTYLICSNTTDTISLIGN